ncbi:MAG TPA: LppX_LprAFG lipoprotein [Marmoricola sp.]|nr:LppX_LprAFG lipoprotein [Marmoricola sp.]
MNPPRRRTRPLLLVAALLSALALSSCAGSGSGSDEAVEPEQRLSTAKTTLDETSGVQIRLATEDLPPGVNGLVSAAGTATHAPAFEGDITVAASGINADAEVVAVDGVVYAKLPFTTDFVEIDPADYGAPDPADLMATENGLSSLLTAARDVESAEHVRDGEAVLSRLTGTLPGDAVADVIPSASADATFDATFTLDESDRVTEIVLTGPFYPDADDVTYTVDLEKYGVEKDITAP